MQLGKLKVMMIGFLFQYLVMRYLQKKYVKVHINLVNKFLDHGRLFHILGMLESTSWK
jgi:hypothetical protein